MSSQQTLGECILAMPDRNSDHVAIKFKSKSTWIEKKWLDYYRDIESAGAGLIAFGVKPGDHIAIMSNTRYEWAVADFANFGIRAVTIPVYQNNTPEDVEYILNDSGARFLICENRAVLKTCLALRERCPNLQKIFVFDPPAEMPDGVHSWNEVLALGRQQLEQDPETYRRLCAGLRPEDTATILYTSGTTGKPKGVVLTHAQAISEVSEAFPLCGVTTEDVSLSFLPYAHILGRIEHWGHTYIGFTMAFAESIERVRSNLQDIRPTILVSVPRIFEKIHSAIWTQMETQPLKLKLFRWALAIGLKVSHLKLTRQPIPLDTLAFYETAKRLVLNKITEAFGGRLRFAISGGAPIAREIVSFFHAANILVLEGYGLTETTAAIAVNTPFNYKFGSVGRPIGDVQIRIAEDGEILVKSQKVMKEYYKDPHATKEAFSEGWFHTGDIGVIADGGELKITDRKKDLIKTAGGKYVAPQKLEGLLKLHPLIGHVLIHGDQKKYIVALITLDRENLEKLAAEKKIPYTRWTELLDHSVVVDAVRNAVADTNAELASYETIKKYLILPQEFTVENGELTPSLKVKRKLLDKKFHAQIESLYG